MFAYLGTPPTHVAFLCTPPTAHVAFLGTPPTAHVAFLCTPLTAHVAYLPHGSGFVVSRHVSGNNSQKSGVF